MTHIKARITVFLLNLAYRSATTSTARLFIKKASDYERDINWI